jgi:hypothetical protein
MSTTETIPAIVRKKITERAQGCGIWVTRKTIVKHEKGVEWHPVRLGPTMMDSAFCWTEYTWHYKGDKQKGYVPMVFVARHFPYYPDRDGELVQVRRVEGDEMRPYLPVKTKTVSRYMVKPAVWEAQQRQMAAKAASTI